MMKIILVNVYQDLRKIYSINVTKFVLPGNMEIETNVMIVFHHVQNVMEVLIYAQIVN